MVAHIIDIEHRPQGGGYVHIRAWSKPTPTHPEPYIVAQASYWPRQRSGYLWSAATLSDQRAGRKPAFGRRPQYNLDEADMLALVVQEATNTHG